MRPHPTTPNVESCKEIISATFGAGIHSEFLMPLLAVINPRCNAMIIEIAWFATSLYAYVGWKITGSL